MSNNTPRAARKAAPVTAKLNALKCEQLARRMERLRTQIAIRQMRDEIRAANANSIK